MLRSIKQLYGNKLGTTDGDLGHVKDFYFSDQNWAIRYLVVDTGTWLPGRLVLLSPHSLGQLDQAEKVLRVSLTRKQIENSPSIESHKPVSRQYEEEYYKYYGWPYYWQGDALWGSSGFPVPGPPAKHPATKPATDSVGGKDAHLRSTLAVDGYQFKTGDRSIGHVCDFMMDAGRWAIDQLVVKTGHRLSGKDMVIPTKDVDRISYEESTVFATLTGEAAALFPAPATAETAIVL